MSSGGRGASYRHSRELGVWSRRRAERILKQRRTLWRLVKRDRRGARAAVHLRITILHDFAISALLPLCGGRV